MYLQLVGGLVAMNFKFPINIGNVKSSQLTKSYFSEGWPNHQPATMYLYVNVGLFIPQCDICKIDFGLKSPILLGCFSGDILMSVL